MRDFEQTSPQVNKKVVIVRRRTLFYFPILLLIFVAVTQLSNTIRFFGLMIGTPRWAGNVSGETLHASKETVCFLLDRSELTRSWLIFTYDKIMNTDVENITPEKLFILLRVLFQVPQEQSRKDARIFGAWIGEGSPFPPDESSTVDLSWPVRYEEEQLILFQSIPISYIGPPYNGFGEYQYFASNFPLRTIEELRCSK